MCFAGKAHPRLLGHIVFMLEAQNSKTHFSSRMNYYYYFWGGGVDFFFGICIAWNLDGIIKRNGSENFGEKMIIQKAPSPLRRSNMLKTVAETFASLVIPHSLFTMMWRHTVV